VRVTLDTGALIAIERRKKRGLMLTRAALEGHVELVTLTPVIAEWWRGRTDRRDTMLASMHVTPLSLNVAQAAGNALASIGGGRLTIDAMVMAFAALHGGDIVYTSDAEDLSRLQAFFPSVRLLSV
jgi:predicted nucleic acid-binding protein